VASGPGRPPAGPSRLAGSLARHPWVTAAVMTAIVAVVAGGGLILARPGSSPGPPRECGLVPCAAALPASVQSTGDGSASAPAIAAPTASKPTAPPPSPVASPTASPAPPAPAGGRVPEGTPPAGPPPAGLPLAGLPPAGLPLAGLPAVAERVSGPEPRSSCTTVIAFTARGALSAPVRCTFTVAAVRPLRSRIGSGHPGSGLAGQHGGQAGGQLRLGRGSHDGRLGSWLGGWLSRGWSGAGWSGAGSSGGGWSGGGWAGGGWAGGGQPGGGWPGQRGGW
jgi:hypothetical protein